MTYNDRAIQLLKLHEQGTLTLSFGEENALVTVLRGAVPPFSGWDNSRDRSPEHFVRVVERNHCDQLLALGVPYVG